MTITYFPKIVLLYSLRVEWLKLWTGFFSFHSASPRNTATQRENFAPFLSKHVISSFSPFFSSFLFIFPYLFYISRILCHHCWIYVMPVNLRISRALWPYLGSLSMCWSVRHIITLFRKENTFKTLGFGTEYFLIINNLFSEKLWNTARHQFTRKYKFFFSPKGSKKKIIKAL